jgi:hypothetical protein
MRPIFRRKIGTGASRGTCQNFILKTKCIACDTYSLKESSFETKG